MGTHSHDNSEYDSLQSNYTNYVADHHHTDTDYNSYVATHSHSDSEYNSLANQVTDLQNQVNDLKAPKLIKVNFGETDNRPLFGAPRLTITGILLNVGSSPAYNCRLHVVLYQSGGVTAEDTYVNQGKINGESWTNVNTDVFYTGSPLTGWTITPEWTS